MTFTAIHKAPMFAPLSREDRELTLSAIHICRNIEPLSDLDRLEQALGQRRMISRQELKTALFALNAFYGLLKAGSVKLASPSSAGHNDDIMNRTEQLFRQLYRQLSPAQPQTVQDARITQLLERSVQSAAEQFGSLSDEEWAKQLSAVYLSAESFQALAALLRAQQNVCVRVSSHLQLLGHHSDEYQLFERTAQQALNMAERYQPVPKEGVMLARAELQAPEVVLEHILGHYRTPGLTDEQRARLERDFSSSETQIQGLLRTIRNQRTVNA